MVALRLFLPEGWTRDAACLKRAGAPVERRAARTKPEIALAEIDRVIAAVFASAVCLWMPVTASARRSARG
jgi:SRSO17 transposase